MNFYQVSAPIDNDMKYVGFQKRFLAYLIDVLVYLPLTPVLSYLVRLTLRQQSLLPFIVSQLIFLAIYAFFLTKMGGTPGKLFLKIQVVDSRKNYISPLSALLRSSSMMIAGVFQILLYWKVFNEIPVGTILPLTNVEIAKILKQYGDPLFTVQFYSSFIFFIDVAFLFFNVKKRALHDYLSGSYVIEKGS